MSTDIRVDPITGLYRFLCECGAGTGQPDSSTESNKAKQWTTLDEAKRERVNHHVFGHRR